MKTQNIDIPIDKITDFCDRWNIIEFALFGSVLRDIALRAIKNVEFRM